MNIIFLIIITLAILPALYLGLLTICAQFTNKQKYSRQLPLRLSVVIPAHNEAANIAQTIQSVKSSAYPNNHVDIFVIADNCTDQTANIARNLQAQVMVREDLQNRGKGAAINDFINRYRETLGNSDAIAFIDADTLVDPDFLQEISDAFSTDYNISVIQGFYGVSNPQANWRTRLQTIALAIAHDLRPRGRNGLGCSASLVGNGMAFKTDLILKTGWPTNSLVEDLDFTLQLNRAGYDIFYLPTAKVYAEMPTTSAQADSQRLRWEGGRLHALSSYVPLFLKDLLGARRLKSIEALFALITPPLVPYFALIFILLILALIFYPPYALIPGLAILILIYQTIAAIRLCKLSFQVWKALILVPFFLLWKIPLYIKMSFNKAPVIWTRTPRQNESKL